MARQLLLEIKTFSIFKKLDRTPLSFEELSKNLFKIEENNLSNSTIIDALKNFIEESYDNLKKDEEEEFVSNKDKTKKYRFQSIKSDPNNSCIYGVFEGGNTGEEGNFNKKIGTKKYSKTKVGLEDFTDSPFFFLVYFPFNSDTGVVMIQKYSDKSLNTEFKMLLKDFFDVKSYKLRYFPFMSSATKAMFKKSSIVEKIVIQQNKTNKNLSKKFDFLQEGKRYKIKIEISEINSPTTEFLKKILNKKEGDIESYIQHMPDLVDIGIDKDQAVLTAHMNESGNTARVKGKDLGSYLDKIIPKEIIPSELKIKYGSNDEYEIEGIKKYITNHLNNVVIKSLNDEQ